MLAWFKRVSFLLNMTKARNGSFAGRWVVRRFLVRADDILSNGYRSLNGGVSLIALSIAS